MSSLSLTVLKIILICWLAKVSIQAPAPLSPTECKSCRGGCYQQPKEHPASVINTTSASTIFVDFETGSNETISRVKRESSVEKRACPNRVHLELFVIPLSIAMIPVALCSLLLCVCYCGPKETRGTMPEKMWGITLSKTNEELKKRASLTDSIYEYNDNYCKRKDSKKTRFNTLVVVIETRRMSDIDISLPSLSPRSISSPVKPQPPLQTVIEELCIESFECLKLKNTRFSDKVEVLGEYVEEVKFKY
uniref:Uncharacterized protein n=1 Tax=Rhabditophanes sp. KR3021 TaxID=114890 RepID=A0AC35U607_9BILA